MDARATPSLVIWAFWLRFAYLELTDSWRAGRHLLASSFPYGIWLGSEPDFLACLRRHLSLTSDDGRATANDALGGIFRCSLAATRARIGIS